MGIGAWEGIEGIHMEKSPVWGARAWARWEVCLYMGVAQSGRETPKQDEDSIHVGEGTAEIMGDWTNK